MRLFLSVAGVAVACATLVAQQKAESCAPAGKPLLLRDVREASGIAVGRTGLWTINDSGQPVLFRVDASGTAARVSVAGASIRDWEDLSFAKCPSGECLYIADIGDNRGARDHITIYRVPEPPAGAAATAPAEIVHLTYPDGPHDAEAMLVVPTRPEIYIITKEVPPRVYRAQISWKPGERVTLMAAQPLPERVRITGAGASPDGRWIVLRSNHVALVYGSEQFAKGGTSPTRIDLASLNEPQGEGIAFAAGNELYLVSESGDDEGAGVLTRLHCAFLK
jgi:hypothetical protein